MIVLEALLAITAGIFAGVTGGGGGVIFIPILLLMGLSPIQAVATSNVAIVITTIAATVPSASRGLIPWRRVLVFAVGAIVMAPFGAFIALRVPAQLLLVALITLNVVNFVVVGRRARRNTPTPASQQAELHEGRTNTGPALVTGGIGGAMAGLFGVGGGIVMVPLQVAWLHTPIRTAARISLAVIVATSGSAVVSYALQQPGTVQWSSGLVIAAGGIIGAPIGAALLRRITNRTATRILQSVLVVVTISLAYRLVVG